MVSVKEARCRNPSQIMRQAPSHSLAPSVCQTWRITEGEIHNEQELLERVLQEICREYGQRCASEVLLNSYQALPPESVSMVDPPERAWLVRLHLVGYPPDQRAGQGEVIVVLRSGEVCIILR